MVESAYELRAHSKVLYTQAETLLMAELGLNTLDLTPQRTYVQTSSQAWSANRLDAEYFQPKYAYAMQKMAQSGTCIKDVAALVRRRFAPERNKTFQYIEIGDVGQYGYTESQIISGEEAPSRAQWIVKTGDVITSTVRPIRRLSALIYPEQDGYVCTSGCVVLKPTVIEPEVLLIYLRLPIICEILDLHTSASMYPAISAEDLLTIPIPIPSKGTRTKIVELLGASYRTRQEAARLLAEAKTRVETWIMGGNTND